MSQTLTGNGSRQRLQQLRAQNPIDTEMDLKNQQNLFKRYLKIMGQDPKEYFYQQQLVLDENGMSKLPENQQKELLAQSLHQALQG